MNECNFIPQVTKDGSYTFYSAEFQEAFHSSHGAKQEAEIKFIQPCRLREIAAQQSTIRLLDICYGLGYNSAAALQAIWSVNPECHIDLIALELDRTVPHNAIKHQLLSIWRSPVPELLTELGKKSLVRGKRIQAQLLLGDARQTIQQVCQGETPALVAGSCVAGQSHWQADAIFLDPFSPPKCPQLWTVEFLSLVAQCLQPDGILATYSCAAAVRTALLAAGLDIGSTKITTGTKSPGTVASFQYKNLPPLSPSAQEHLETRAAIPYRDKKLRSSKVEILDLRQKEQENSDFEPTSQWKKRWLLSNIQPNDNRKFI